MLKPCKRYQVVYEALHVLRNAKYKLLVLLHGQGSRVIISSCAELMHIKLGDYIKMAS